MDKLNVSEFLALQDQVAALKGNYDVLKTNSDTFFLLVVALIIYFMQCGFALLECGSVRSKNCTNILIKNVLDSFVGGVAYWLVGYALAFGGGNPFCGVKYWAHMDMPANLLAHWFFHFVFAATAATIVSGAMAERCDFVAYLVYSFVITGVVYPIATHWAWSAEGWLAVGLEFTEGNSTFTVTYQDFAGSGVVHVLGAVAAIIGAAFLGPRIGRFDEETGSPQEIKGHSVPLAALGGFILFFGFFAFNGGSQASISAAGDGEAIALSMINTVISATFAAFAALFLSKLTGNKWSLLTTINGALTGMVAICAGCNAVHTWGAAAIGLVAGIAYLAWSNIVLKVFRVDDPLDAFAVHGGGGMWGVIATPLLAKDTGLFFTWSRQAFLQLGWNLAGMGAIAAWCGAVCIIMFGFLRVSKLLRVSEDIELKGLDIPKHAEPAYPVEAYGHGWGEKGDALKSITKLAAKNMAKFNFNPAASAQEAMLEKHISNQDSAMKQHEGAEMEANHLIKRSMDSIDSGISATVITVSKNMDTTVL